MRAYSVDLRQRVLAAVDRGMPRPQVVATFGVSLATLKRWLALRESGLALIPQSPPGRPQTIAPEHAAPLRAQWEAHHDASFATHARLWQESQGIALSEWTLGRAIRRLGWTRKKSP
jgi:transposase